MTPEEASITIHRLIDGSKEVDDAKALQTLVRSIRRWLRRASAESRVSQQPGARRSSAVQIYRNCQKSSPTYGRAARTAVVSLSFIR
jgi:hypothetical protein